jgi:hypothetical protein
MLKPIKNTKKTIVKAAHLAVWTALLLAGCGNDFINEAIGELKPPSPDSSNPTIGWSSDPILIEPGTGGLSGTISGNINAFGNIVQFDRNELSTPSESPNAPDGRPEKWKFEPLITEMWDLVPPGSMAEFLVGGTPVISGNDNVITLTFEGLVDSNVLPSDFTKSGNNYSFILYPDAFYGKDAGKLTAEAATLNFRVEMPTPTNYAKYLIEKENYGPITVSWADGISVTSAPDTAAGMKYLAGSLAAGSATVIFDHYVNPLSADNFPSVGSAGSFSADKVVWVSEPDLSKGYWTGKSTLRLEPILADHYDDEAEPEFSVQVNFTSDVGDAIILINQAKNAGSFDGINGSVDAVKTAVEGSLSSLSLPIAGSEVIVGNSGKRDHFKVQIVLTAGKEDPPSPGGTVEITIP